MENRKKILVVDDEPDVRRYLQAIFEDNGFDVITAINGKECLSKAVSERPSLITLDISMPAESGVRAFRDLQDNSLTNDIPVIVITGVSGEFKNFISTRKQVFPPVDYFEKPIDREKLIESIKNILKLTSQQ